MGDFPGGAHPIAIVVWFVHTFYAVYEHQQYMSKNTSRAPVRAVRVNISMPPTLRDVAEQVCIAKGYNGLSDYIQGYLRRDAVGLGHQQFALHPGV